MLLDTVQNSEAHGLVRRLYSMVAALGVMLPRVGTVLWDIMHFGVEDHVHMNPKLSVRQGGGSS